MKFIIAADGVSKLINLQHFYYKLEACGRIAVYPHNNNCNIYTYFLHWLQQL